MNVNSKRPALTRKLGKEVFLSYSYKKIELMTFCEREKLETSGDKRKLTQRVAHFLATGKQLTSKESKHLNNKSQIKDTDLIKPNFLSTDRNREFFIEKIGNSFTFITPFKLWLKENAGKTYRDAVTVYFQMIEKRRVSSQLRNRTMRVNTDPIEEEDF